MPKQAIELATMEKTSKATIYDFGDQLIHTGDLDPVYIAIYGAQLSRPQLCRLLTAYWCFYHLGAAAWMSEHHGAGFWYALGVAARNEDVSPIGGRWPRAAERRHFRGQLCVDAVEWLSQKPPEYWVESLSSLKTDESVMSAVKQWPLHGPWIAFKAADMMERCVGQRITFSGDLGLIYMEPRAGLDMVAARDESLTAVGHYARLLEHFGQFRAPPGMDRACGPQEVETVLCKWKSHMNGHYTVGKDIKEVRHALEGWGDTANRMLRAAPDKVSL